MDEAWKIIKEKDVSRPKPLVAGSISTYAAQIGAEYNGEYNGVDDEFLKTFHRARMISIANEKPDILACETIPRLQEVRVILELINEPEIKAIGVPAWISITCSDGEHLNSGEKVSDFIELIKEYEGKTELLAAVGANCSPPLEMAQLIGSISKSGTKLPILVYANSGEIYD